MISILFLLISVSEVLDWINSLSIKYMIDDENNWFWSQYNFDFKLIIISTSSWIWNILLSMIIIMI
jgi:hypothetical protein